MRSNNEKFAAWAKEKRVGAKLSQRQAMILLGRNVKDIERGKVGPGFETCRALGHGYGISRVEWLRVWLGSVPGLAGVDIGPAAAELAKAMHNHADG